MGISEDANAAADYIETHGWIQGNYYDEETGATCMAGALARATDNNYLGIFHGGEKEMPYREFLDVTDITVWNDKLGRTQEEVVQVLRDVATKHMPDEMTQGGN